MSTPVGSAGVIPRNVARAVVIKNQDVFFLSEHDGRLPPHNQDGFGLYQHDCRYLDGYEISIAGTHPNPLVATADRGSIAEFKLTNDELKLNGRTIPAQTFGIALQRTIDGEHAVVRDAYTISNYDVEEHELPLSLRFDADFADIFVIRGLHAKKVGEQNRPKWQDDALVLSYKGADDLERRLSVHFDPMPQKKKRSEAHYLLRIPAGAHKQITVSLCINESKERCSTKKSARKNIGHVANALDDGSRQWLAKYAEVESDNALLNGVTRRCLLDLLVLRSELDGHHYIAAGLPWYGALFGRDSIIAALQTLPYEPNIAAETLRLLALYQGTKKDEWRDEEPGKILHELRRGELANLSEIPQTPYYGSVDSTPLFLILIGEHARWTGDLALFRELQSHVQRALDWIDSYGTDASTGYVCYATKSKKGLGNQGWKDSGNSIVNADGSLAKPPIALIEVQGYVHYAKLLLADLYKRSGDEATCTRLLREAADLKRRVNQDFWLEDRQFYAIALQKNNKPAAVVSSNPGQALWTGVLDKSRVAMVMRALTAPDMFTGWGIRTLSANEQRFNPVGYHLGTVWPHDNSIIAAGFRRYGFDEAALRVFDGILHAARYFQHNRLPEVFAGYSRKEIPVPVRYPVACHPQAWAAGSVPFLLTTLLGLVPHAFESTLHVVNPVLPEDVNEVNFRRIKIGPSEIDLKFRRDATRIVVEVDRRGADIDVTVQGESHGKAA